MVMPVVTERLILRPFDSDDLDAVHAYVSDPEVMTYMGGTQTREWVRGFLKWHDNYRAEHGYGLWAMVERASGDVVGDAGVMALGGSSSIAGHRLRYMVNRAYWGRGYATEAAHASLDFAFRELGVEEVKAITHPDHQASQHVLEKIGMTYEGLVTYDGLDGTDGQVALHVASRPVYHSPT